jgi:hypothetical protein
MSFFASNCNNVLSGRNEWVQAIMEETPVHSYGGCFKNMKLPDNCKRSTGYDEKLCAISKYKFHLSFENSIDYSYVTEKFFQGKVLSFFHLTVVAFRAGTVPVYLGAPNIAEYDPLYEPLPNGSFNYEFKPKSFIQVSGRLVITDLI